MQVECPANRECSLSSVEAESEICERELEARVGIEPTHKGFADPFLVTPNPSDSTQAFIKSIFRPLFVRFGREYSADSGKVLQNPQPRRNKKDGEV
jgi:hypothetical protein